MSHVGQDVGNSSLGGRLNSLIIPYLIEPGEILRNELKEFHCSAVVMVKVVKPSGAPDRVPLNQPGSRSPFDEQGKMQAILT